MADPKPITLERGWNLILLDAHIPPENVLRRAGLPADVLTREQVRASTDEYFALWHAIAAEDPDPALPIRLGGRHDARVAATRRRVIRLAVH